MMIDAAPLILTLETDERSFAFFDAQRRRSFPPERNFIPAHITLFHHLPGRERAAIADTLLRTALHQKPMTLTVAEVRFLGRGVAYAIRSPEADLLRASLAEEWRPWLTPQDRQKHAHHVTVQNKVPPDVARALFDELRRDFTPFTATATGLHLWTYRGGPWDSLQVFPFSG
jgi:hypothetical protein